MNDQLKEHISSKSNAELIGVIESKEGDYKPEAKLLAHKILTERSVDESELLQMARDLLKKRILVYFKSFDVINDTFELPQSNLLTEVEVKSIFSQTFAKWKSEQDDMIPDGWRYVPAACLG